MDVPSVESNGDGLTVRWTSRPSNPTATGGTPIVLIRLLASETEEELPMIVALTGYRATGKTTIGQLLADRLGWDCVDTDAEVQHVVGKSIGEIFEQEGQTRFREYESQVIQRLSRRNRTVLALGGGAVLCPENRQTLSVAGPLVWLTASPDTIRRRLQGDPQSGTQRPPLTEESASDEIERVLQDRLPIYRACANLTIDTEGCSPREIVDQIVDALDLAPETGLS